MRIKVTWPYFVSRYLLQCRIQDIFNIDDGGMQAGCENISTKILKRESSAFTFPENNKGSSPHMEPPLYYYCTKYIVLSF